MYICCMRAENCDINKIAEKYAYYRQFKQGRLGMRYMLLIKKNVGGKSAFSQDLHEQNWASQANRDK
jgi:hypothetical protein